MNKNWKNQLFRFIVQVHITPVILTAWCYSSSSKRTSNHNVHGINTYIYNICIHNIYATYDTVEQLWTGVKWTERQARASPEGTPRATRLLSSSFYVYMQARFSSGFGWLVKRRCQAVAAGTSARYARSAPCCGSLWARGAHTPLGLRPRPPLAI